MAEITNTDDESLGTENIDPITIWAKLPSQWCAKDIYIIIYLHIEFSFSFLRSRCFPGLWLICSRFLSSLGFRRWKKTLFSGAFVKKLLYCNLASIRHNRCYIAGFCINLLHQCPKSVWTTTALPVNLYAAMFWNVKIFIFLIFSFSMF